MLRKPCNIHRFGDFSLSLIETSTIRVTITSLILFFFSSTPIISTAFPPRVHHSNGNFSSFLFTEVHSSPSTVTSHSSRRIYNIATLDETLQFYSLTPSSSSFSFRPTSSSSSHVFHSRSVKLQCPRAESRSEAPSSTESNVSRWWSLSVSFTPSDKVQSDSDRFQKLLANSSAEIRGAATVN